MCYRLRFSKKNGFDGSLVPKKAVKAEEDSRAGESFGEGKAPIVPLKALSPFKPFTIKRDEVVELAKFLHESSKRKKQRKATEEQIAQEIALMKQQKAFQDAIEFSRTVLKTPKRESKLVDGKNVLVVMDDAAKEEFLWKQLHYYKRRIEWYGTVLERNYRYSMCDAKEAERLIKEGRKIPTVDWRRADCSSLKHFFNLGVLYKDQKVVFVAWEDRRKLELEAIKLRKTLKELEIILKYGSSGCVFALPTRS